MAGRGDLHGPGLGVGVQRRGGAHSERLLAWGAYAARHFRFHGGFTNGNSSATGNICYLNSVVTCLTLGPLMNPGGGRLRDWFHTLGRATDWHKAVLAIIDLMCCRPQAERKSISLLDLASVRRSLAGWQNWLLQHDAGELLDYILTCVRSESGADWLPCVGFCWRKWHQQGSLVWTSVAGFRVLRLAWESYEVSDVALQSLVSCRQNREDDPVYITDNQKWVWLQLHRAHVGDVSRRRVFCGKLLDVLAISAAGGENVLVRPVQYVVMAAVLHHGAVWRHGHYSVAMSDLEQNSIVQVDDCRDPRLLEAGWDDMEVVRCLYLVLLVKASELPGFEL